MKCIWPWLVLLCAITLPPKVAFAEPLRVVDWTAERQLALTYAPASASSLRASSEVPPPTRDALGSSPDRFNSSADGRFRRVNLGLAASGAALAALSVVPGVLALRFDARAKDCDVGVCEGAAARADRNAVAANALLLSGATVLVVAFTSWLLHRSLRRSAEWALRTAPDSVGFPDAYPRVRVALPLGHAH